MHKALLFIKCPARARKDKDMKRQSGVLMHVSSLYGDYSCGSFGKEAIEFVDFLEKSGFSCWQTLPFCMTDTVNSPYKSYSSFGGNPNFIDLEELAAEGLITELELEMSKQKTPYVCEFDRLNIERLPLLKLATERCSKAKKAKINKFIRENPYLEQVCHFMALLTANDNKSWFEWTTEKYDKSVYDLWKFIEYTFFDQWSKIKKYANSKGISIIGDIPIYVSDNSADVWANRDMFLLDEDGKPTVVAGVPPDYFSEDGQLWGNPLYNWEKMAQDGFTWWKDRVKHMYKMFDGVRIDHFRGLESFWSIPANAKTAKKGKWVKGPGKAFIDAIQSVTDPKKNFIIAEDLGEITPEVEELVKYSGYPGMRVFQFGFFGDDSSHMPHNYTENCIAYSGTHDNNTLLGYIWEQEESERREMFDYIGYEGDDRDRACDIVVRNIMASHASTVIFPIQDLLGFGADTRMNTPGKSEGNWAFRITKDQLGRLDPEKYRRLNRLYKRGEL